MTTPDLPPGRALDRAIALARGWILLDDAEGGAWWSVPEGDRWWGALANSEPPYWSTDDAAALGLLAEWPSYVIAKDATSRGSSWSVTLFNGGPLAVNRSSTVSLAYAIALADLALRTRTKEG